MVDFMATNGIEIAAVQETKLRPGSGLKSPPGYSIVRSDRPIERGNGGGLAFIIRGTVNHRVLDPPTPSGDEHLKQQGIELREGSSGITIFNIYCPCLLYTSDAADE